ncbi:MAG: hypothetical protein RDU24_15445 [Humidesulfovibrio sp.]|uniref:hypothetical protein n=1 Tax=Humidesulfovibrio sp. TaxID=2910988 RepID=UPI0027F6799F|nr:hypothetical protein [Humidesulfovibrio sp.]MDQ7836773.1 hypothetical protein [Humidesulfovibrio sp.]
MKSSYRKKLEKASNFLREVFDDLETEGSDDFDTFGTRLEDLAGEIDDMLAEDEANARDGDEEDGYEVE